MAPEGGAAHVVVVGAGFAGLWTVRGLAGSAARVTLLDRNNYHTFFPLLYQVAAAELGPADIAYPIRSILRGWEGVRFMMGEALSLDPEARVLRTTRGPLAYELLVLCTGSVPSFFGVKGAAEQALCLRDMNDALALRRSVLSRFEEAALEVDPERRRALVTFVIVGGGPTGVEFAGALAELVFGPLLRDYPTVSPGEPRIMLLEAGDSLLPVMESRLGVYACRRLGDRGVEVHLGARVRRIDSDGVVLADGSHLKTMTAVWTAGIKGDPRLRAWDLPRGPGGRVLVTPALQVEGQPLIFVAGDLALATDGQGRALPQTAPVAVQQGEHVAKAIRAVLRGQLPPSFRYCDPGLLAVVGRNAAVAQFGGRTFTGFVAWALWALVHIAKLVGFRNRALVLVNWAWNYVSFARAVRLILPHEQRGREARPGT